MDSCKNALWMQFCCVEFITLEAQNLAKLFPNASLQLGNTHLDAVHSLGIIVALIVLPTCYLRDLRKISLVTGKLPIKDLSQTSRRKIFKAYHSNYFHFYFCSWRYSWGNMHRTFTYLRRYSWRHRISSDGANSEVEWLALLPRCVWVLLLGSLCAAKPLPLNVK